MEATNSLTLVSRWTREVSVPSPTTTGGLSTHSMSRRGLTLRTTLLGWPFLRASSVTTHQQEELEDFKSNPDKEEDLPVAWRAGTPSASASANRSTTLLKGTRRTQSQESCRSLASTTTMSKMQGRLASLMERMMTRLTRGS